MGPDYVRAMVNDAKKKPRDFLIDLANSFIKDFVNEVFEYLNISKKI